MSQEDKIFQIFDILYPHFLGCPRTLLLTDLPILGEKHNSTRRKTPGNSLRISAVWSRMQHQDVGSTLNS